MIAPDDPRICKTPFAEFDHLTLAEVEEHERLELASRDRSLNLADLRRLRELRARRHHPNIGERDGRGRDRDRIGAHRALQKPQMGTV